MSSEAKFGEPFTWDAERGLFDSKGNEVVESDEIRERFLACLNACQGIPSPAAIPAVIKLARGAHKFLKACGYLEAQVFEEALAALEGK